MTEDPTPYGPHNGSEPTPEPRPLHLLDACYNEALIGHSVSVHAGSRPVYSLNRLVRIEQGLNSAPGKMQVLAEAQVAVANMVKEVTESAGDDAPSFVDDWVGMLRGKPEKPRIIRPGGCRPRR